MKLSVITVAYNAARTLGDALESVAHQSHSDIDHWVIDGGSADETRQIVKRHGEHLAGFVSETDAGLYDAMNKGIDRAKGSAIGFLNADDWYAGSEVLHRVNECFERGADFVYGDLAFVSPETPFAVERIWRDSLHNPDDFFRCGWQPAHPSSFIRLDLLREIGGFDTRWRIGADYAMLARVMLQPMLRMEYIPERITNMRVGGASTKNLGAVWRANRECTRALAELGFRFPWATIALKVARKIPQVIEARTRAKILANAALWRPWALERT